MKRTAPPTEYTAGELGPLVGASESMLLRLGELDGITIANPGGLFMACRIESTFWVAAGEIEEIRRRLLAARSRGLIVD
jgi:hypothetical protein